MRKVIHLPRPENRDLRFFIVNHLRQQNISRDQIWVDRYRNDVVINGDRADVIEKARMIYSLIAEYNEEQERRNSTEGKMKVGIPKHLIGLVIGTHFYNIKQIEEKTGAKIDAINRELYVSGNDTQCKKAIRELKSSARNKLFRHYTENQFPCSPFDYVDSMSDSLELVEQIDMPNVSWPREENYFKISTDDDEQDHENSSNGTIAMSDRGLNKFVKEVLENLQANKDANNQFPRTDCWLHFGHVFVSGRNVDEDDQVRHFKIEEFQKQFNNESVESDQKWKMCFKSAVEEMEVTHLKEALSGSEVGEHNVNVLPPHTRYDIAFITPSCNRIRIKIFIDPDGHPMVTKEFLKQFTDLMFDVRQVQASPSAVYLLCDPFYYRAKINIAIPSRSMDVRMNIRQISTKTPEKIEQEEEEFLIREYLDKITIEDGRVVLPDEMPYDFCLDFFRKCERESYCYDDGELSYIIVISKEQEINTENDGGEFETDVHVKSVEINKLLRSGVWTPDDIIAKLPRFLSAVKDIQTNIDTSQDSTD